MVERVTGKAQKAPGPPGNQPPGGLGAVCVLLPAYASPRPWLGPPAVFSALYLTLNPMAAWIPYALLSALFAALTAIFAKIGIKGVDSDLATAIRTVVILLLAWGIALARGATAGLPALTGRTWLFLVLSGLATGGSWLCYFRALKLGPVSKVAPVDKLSVALSLLLAVVFLGETISVRGALGAGLILAGTVVLVWA